VHMRAGSYRLKTRSREGCAELLPFDLLGGTSADAPFAELRWRSDDYAMSGFLSDNRHWLQRLTFKNTERMPP
jgi:hypothetical protein